MTNDAIFTHIGLTREQIVAYFKGHTKPDAEVFERELERDQRPLCLVCGHRISKYTCRPYRQRALAPMVVGDPLISGGEQTLDHPLPPIVAPASTLGSAQESTPLRPARPATTLADRPADTQP